VTATRVVSGFHLAPLGKGHRAALEALVRATGVFREDEIAVALEVFDSALGDEPDDYTLVGALDEAGALLGYACYGPTPCTVRTWDLYWIVVHPAAQGRGVGTALLNDVERQLEIANARLLVIETSSKNDYAATRGFYRSRGYEPAARVPDFYDIGDDRVIYVKRLGAPKESA
jgi:ribosomal protein S18 acetylase RimI-like enzyme